MPTAAEARDLVADLLALVHRCHARGWVLATSGNFSARVDGERFVVTASGLDKGALGVEDLGFVWFDGRASFPPGRRASAETPLHAALYARDPGIHAIAHTHSTAATVLSRAATGAVTLRGWEMLKGLAGVTSHEATITLPVVANDQDVPRLAEAAGRALDAAPGAVGYLIAGHGLYTWGTSIAEATRHVEALEFALGCELAARSLAAAGGGGGPR